MNWNTRYAMNHYNHSGYTQDNEDLQRPPNGNGHFGDDVENHRRDKRTLINPKTYKCDQCGDMKPIVRRRIRVRSNGSTFKFDVCTDCETE